MKKILCIFINILLITIAVKAQRYQLNKLFDTTISINSTNTILGEFANGSNRQERNFSGLVPDSVFNSIIYRDYNKLGVISSALPQSSLLFDVGKKEINANYSGFFNSVSMLNGRPVSFNVGTSLDFDDESKRSVFISEGKLTANLKFSGGFRFFLPALATYTAGAELELRKKAVELNTALRESGFSQLQVMKVKTCDCRDTTEAVFKSYNCKIVRSIPQDTCITGDEKRYNRFLESKAKEMVKDIFMSAEFSKKIYRWIGTDIIYSRPSVNTVNRLNNIDARLNTRVFNNTGFTLSYNVLNIYQKTAQYFIYSVSYAHSENTAALTATDVNYNRRIESQGTTTYYESKTKKAYDTTLLKDTRGITLGFDYYYFFKNIVGFSGSLRTVLGYDADIKRKIELGILFPIVQKDKTKTVFTLYYSMKSTSSDILNGRYPGELGFKIGVPVDMFSFNSK